MTKSLDVILEYLGDDKTRARATARQDNRTVAYFDGTAAQATQLCEKALQAIGGAHRGRDGSYDFTYIYLNDAAKVALAIN